MLYTIRDLIKTRQREKGYRLIVKNLAIAKGARVALTGPSGCGKSTTLDMLGLSLSPDSADEFTFAPLNRQIDILALWQSRSLDALASLRLEHLGYVLQSGELLPFLSAGANMTLTARLAGVSEAEAEANARDLAAKLGIASLWHAMPDTLSVGERQRAAIARALAARPQVILADEPTAALDPIHAEKVMDVFLECVMNYGSALILVTHNVAWAKTGGFREVAFSISENELGVTATVDDTKAPQ